MATAKAAMVADEVRRDHRGGAGICQVHAAQVVLHLGVDRAA